MGLKIESNSNLHEKIKASQEKDAGRLALESTLQDEANSWKVLRHFSQQPSFSACLPSGRVVRLSEGFLSLSSPSDTGYFSFHPCLSACGYLSVDNVNILMGKVEKYWPKPSSLIASSQLEHMRSVIAPLDGASIQVNIRHSVRSLGDLREETDPFSERALIDKIIELSDQGMRRDDIRYVLCPTLPVDSWRAIWKEAAKLKPEIMRSGPKPRRSIRN